jgi:hypothetical protein
MGHVDKAIMSVPSPRPHENYATFLARCEVLERGFTVAELVRQDPPGFVPDHLEPPRELWARMVPTLALANELWARMRNAGARGLLVAAAYRPKGGAPDSQHKHNAALDLDLLPGDAHLQRTFADVAADLWREHEHLRCGAGTYAPRGAIWTNRVHIDTGYRFRAWQGLPGGGWDDLPAILVLAPPDETDLDNRAYVAGPDQLEDCVPQGGRWPR